MGLYVARRRRPVLPRAHMHADLLKLRAMEVEDVPEVEQREGPLVEQAVHGGNLLLEVPKRVPRALGGLLGRGALFHSQLGDVLLAEVEALPPILLGIHRRLAALRVQNKRYADIQRRRRLQHSLRGCHTATELIALCDQPGVGGFRGRDLLLNSAKVVLTSFRHRSRVHRANERPHPSALPVRSERVAPQPFPDQLRKELADLRRSHRTVHLQVHVHLPRLLVARHALVAHTAARKRVCVQHERQVRQLALDVEAASLHEARVWHFFSDI